MNAPIKLFQSIQTRDLDAITFRRPVRERRPFGAYYTPRNVADTLTRWAIRSIADVVLEPGFGGCGFLESSQSRIEALGSANPFSLIYGCDKDENAFKILGHKIGEGDHDKRFLLGDFLRLHPKDFQVPGFDVAIGNPPYVSLHAMQPEQLASAIEAMSLGKFTLDKRASLWAYFVLHALTFLRPKGRCAWVLPSSYLHAAYASDVRILLADRFSSVVEITLEQRLFSAEGAKEKTVIVLAEGYELPSCEHCVQRFHATDAEELADIVSSLTNKTTRLAEGFASPIEEATTLIGKVKTKLVCRQLGKFLDVKIGIVTGANDFFIKGEADWKELGVGGTSIRPILPKFNQVSGLALTTNDLQENRKNGLKCLLLDVSESRSKSKKITQYLASFPPEKHAKNATFKKRACWHYPDDGKVPHAFLSYMCDHGPRLTLNPANTTSTNTIHRVYFHDNVDDIRRKAIAISILTTVTQLSAELIGRSYGSGVLKLEPNEARRIDIVLPDVLDVERVGKIFIDVDKLLREGKTKEARLLADELFVTPLLSRSQIVAMEATLVRLRRIRREPRKSL